MKLQIRHHIQLISVNRIKDTRKSPGSETYTRNKHRSKNGTQSVLYILPSYKNHNTKNDKFWLHPLWILITDHLSENESVYKT